MDEPPTYTKTDLVAMLRESQSAVNRLVSDVGEPDSIHSLHLSQRLVETYGSLVKIQAPMVRCSRPAFRRLCRLWGTDVSYTHMIMADSFARADSARHADFALYSGEDRLVCQIASSSGPDAAVCAAFLSPYCDAFDLNCGCPQSWAIRDGVGSALLRRPEVVADVVRSIRNSGTGGVSLPCTVKMRVDADVRRSVDFARQAEAAGAAWITVHGRTPSCSAHAPVQLDAIRTVCEALAVPVVANGGVHDPKSALATAMATRAAGVMSASGLLANPACFYTPRSDEALHFAAVHLGEAEKEIVGVRNNEVVWPIGLPHCPLEVVSDFIRLSAATGLSAKATGMHLLKMGGNYLGPAERVFLSQFYSSIGVTMAFRELGLYVEDGKYSLSSHTIV